MSSTDKSNFREFFQTLFSGQIAPGRPAEYKRENHQQIVEKWRKTFALKLNSSTGEWRIGGYDWHVFTYGYASALAGKRAIDSYARKTSHDGYVFTHTVEEPLCCFSRHLPSYAAIEHVLELFPDKADIYVVGRDFQWTFVVTHETSCGVGPFFCEASSMKHPSSQGRSA